MLDISRTSGSVLNPIGRDRGDWSGSFRDLLRSFWQKASLERPHVANAIKPVFNSAMQTPSKFALTRETMRKNCGRIVPKRRLFRKAIRITPQIIIYSFSWFRALSSKKRALRGVSWLSIQQSGGLSHSTVLEYRPCLRGYLGNSTNSKKSDAFSQC